MNVDHIRARLKQLEDDGTVIKADFLAAGYGRINAFVMLKISPPYSKEREQQLTQIIQQATGFPAIPVYFEYDMGGRDEQ